MSTILNSVFTSAEAVHTYNIMYILFKYVLQNIILQ